MIGTWRIATADQFSASTVMEAKVMRFPFVRRTQYSKAENSDLSTLL